MQEIRVAVVGLGTRALRGWIPIMQKLRGYRITALCEEIPALQTRAFVQRPELQGIKMYGHYDDVLADPNVDAIALTVRSRLQGAMAAQGLEAGKHVHSEVPMAHTVEECWRIINAVKSSGKTYLLGEQTRYWGFVDAWREIVQGGQIGKPTYCEGQYLGYYGTQWYFRDSVTGEFCQVEDLPHTPNARSTWFMEMPPIHYLPHELSPMLKVLDDRVVEVGRRRRDACRRRDHIGGFPDHRGHPITRQVADHDGHAGRTARHSSRLSRLPILEKSEYAAAVASWEHADSLYAQAKQSVAPRRPIISSRGVAPCRVIDFQCRRIDCNSAKGPLIQL